MEQIDTNETAEKVISAKETPMYDRKPVLQIATITGLILLMFLYLKVWVPRQECISKIYYHPATESSTKGLGIQGKSEHYTYLGRDFKTRSEAISYCLSNR